MPYHERLKHELSGTSFKKCTLTESFDDSFTQKQKFRTTLHANECKKTLHTHIIPLASQ